MPPNFWPERLRLDEFRRSLSKQERAEFERRRRRRTHTRRALPAVLLEWAGYVEVIVSELDEEFSLDPHEYLHALTIRDAVKEFASELPTGLEAKVKAWLAPVDERFRGVTDTEDEFLIASLWASCEAAPPPEAWWWKRLPVRGQLHDDFRSGAG